MTSEQLHPDPQGSYPPQTLPRMECHSSDGEKNVNEGFCSEEPPLSTRHSRPSTPSSMQPSSSSSSSSSAGGGLGVLASMVEQAIARWARGARRASSPSSSSSSTSSSEASENTRRFSIYRRRRRRSSASSLHTNLSERDIAARITRLKALEESRQIPRQFILYLPSRPVHSRSYGETKRLNDADFDSEGVMRTSSLSSVLSQLEGSLRRSTRGRRLHSKFGANTLRHTRNLIPKPPRQSVIINAESGSVVPVQGSYFRRGGKGKHRENGNHLRYLETTGKASRAWFLDVSSPTWGDLKAIGKLLHLHPLTLEDILQQDPREKLDLFQKLGYYFVSFRAIETREDRGKSQRQIQRIDGRPENLADDDGAVRETNVYLVVFDEGICCFHYNDIAEHTDRVRNRITMLEQVANMSSDWIAHGILDSIVDSFFPYLENIEKEVMAIEELVFSPTAVYPPTIASTNASPPINAEESEKPRRMFSVSETLSFSEKSSIGGSVRPRFAAPKLTLHLLSRRIRRFFVRLWRRRVRSREAPPTATVLTLRQMARTRRLVTSLGRLLASKSEVVTQIKKRLLKTGTSGPNIVSAEELEIAMYMGDIEDHILTLQHSLNHYERMLSQSHPAYLSLLRTIFVTSKSGTDKSLVYLTSVSIAVLCVQLVLANCSMNVNLPHDTTGFKVFGIVLSIAIIVLFIYALVVRYWWKQAGKRRRALL